MNPKVDTFLRYVGDRMPKHDKQRAIDATQEVFHLIKDGKVYYCEAFAVRFCYSKNQNFSNTVLSLSKLQKFDHIPFFVVLIRHDLDNVLYLANSSLLKKISHSSQMLSVNNIRGSFNGSDIIKQYGDESSKMEMIPNDVRHVKDLFAIHQGFSWKDNLERLVDASSKIKPIKQKFIPTAEQTVLLKESIQRAIRFVESDDYLLLKKDLDERVKRKYDLILVASHIENTNIRGRLIEHLITSDEEMLPEDIQTMEDSLPTYDTKNGLGDYIYKFKDETTYTDIKTKIMYLDSNPKAYNVDKFLEKMSEENSVFMLYLIGIDAHGIKNCELCSVYDSRLIDAIIVQPHWAGRSTRGVVQFKGSTLREILLSQPFNHHLSQRKAEGFVEMLLGR